MGNSKRVFLIGLDGVNQQMLQLPIRLGLMPNLARLLDAGRCGLLRSVVPTVTPVAWSSFATGKLPAKHGILDFRRFDPITLADRLVSSTDVRSATLWQVASAAGARVGVVNLPLNYPPPAVNGEVVAGFDTPSTQARFTYPAQLRQRLLARWPDYFFVPAKDPSDKSKSARLRLLSRAQRAVQLRAELAEWLLSENDYDLFMVHFQVTDWMAHDVFGYLVPHDRLSLDADISHAVLQLYEQLDAAVGELLTLARGRFAHRLIVSDHGFGPNWGIIYPNVLLRNWGYLVLDDSRPPPTQELSWMDALRSLGFHDEIPLQSSRTRAYVSAAESHALLYVNRHSDSPVGPAQREALIDELAARLGGLRNPITNRRVFVKIERGEKYFVRAGSVVEHPPDLVLTPAEGFFCARSLRSEHPVTCGNGPWGCHRPDGLLIVDGARFRGCQFRARLIDIAPTVLTLMGLAVPRDLDGMVLRRLFGIGKVRYCPPVPATQREDGYTGGEAELVARHLQSLGYLQ